MLNASPTSKELGTSALDPVGSSAAAAGDVASITVPDAHLLFNGEFKRVGTSDLKIVGEDGESFFIPGYFASENRAQLMSPEGATLSPQVVEALAGPLAPGQSAQAGAQPSSQPVIGRVDVVSGSATVVRNGVTASLNVGDTVRQGDVVQTSGNSSVAIVLTDGSTFSLNANARMVMDSFVYTAGGTGNSALINLVQGTVSFVAGQMAKSGDMRVETPVAIMGIRGTAVLVEISASDGTTRFSVMIEPDGTTGSFNLYNKTTGALIATVSNAQIGWVVTPSGPLQVVAQQVQKTPGELAQEIGIIQQIFTIFNNNQQNPFVAPPGDRGDVPGQQNNAAAGGGSGQPLTVTLPIVIPDSPTPVNFDVVITPVIDGNTTTADPTTQVPDQGTGGGTPPTDTGTPTPSGPNLIDRRAANEAQAIVGQTGDDVIHGSQFGDSIDAGAGNDTVFGEGGSDAIVAGSGEGNDSYDGGSGQDVIIFTSANGVVFHLNLSEVDGVKESTAQSFLTGNDVFTNIEVIVASPGNDIFNVHLDGDWILEGGAGFDTLSLADRSEGIVADLLIGSVSGSATLVGTVSASQLGTIAFSDIESVIGSSGDDIFNVNNLSEWSALDDANGWEIRGGDGSDELRIIGATGLTYELNAEVFFGTVFSTIDIETGQLRFASIESIVAGAGNDVFVVRDLANIAIDAGGGIDRADYRNVSGAIAVNLAAGTITGAVTNTLRSVENITGTQFADTYVATGFSGASANAGSNGTFNEFEGGAGNDTITGNGNTRITFHNATAGVTVDLQAGTATGNASVGSDSFTGVNAITLSQHDDTMFGLDNAPGSGDVFDGRAGNDTFYGFDGLDTAVYHNDQSVTGAISVNLAAGTVTGDASIGTDTLRSVENVIGTRFADTYVATGFNGTSANAGSFGTTNSFEGLAGNDTVTGNGSTILVFVRATAGVTADIVTGTAFATAADASIGTDTFSGVGGLRGSNFNDTLRGSNTTAIIETFIGEGGDDLLNGRLGLDRAIYASILNDTVTGGISVNMASGIVTGDASVGTDTLRSIEMVRGSRFADTYLATGFSGTSQNAGSNGTFNEFEGGAGNDTIAGNGNTRIAFYNATGGVTVDLAAGTATGNASVGSDTFSLVNAVAGSQHDDTMFGLDNAPGSGDVFDGRAGNDFFDGRGGLDTAVYHNDQSVTGGISVNLAAGTVTGDASVGVDTLRSVEHVIGTGFADDFDAVGFGASSINAGSSGDLNSFEGMGGNDTVTGNGSTTMVFVRATAGVTADIVTGTAFATAADASIGTDTFTGVSGLRGSNFNDILRGSDTIAVIETFTGERGNDLLNGRLGLDRAIYSSGLNDTVTGGISVDMASGIVTGDVSVGTDTLRSIEMVRGSRFADSYVATGFSGTSTNAGSNGTFNEFEGRAGNDSIIGNLNTRLAFYNATGGVTVDIAAGTASGNASVGSDTFSWVNAIAGSQYDDTIRGANNASGTIEFFEGRAGNDDIDGRGGFDEVIYGNDLAVTGGISVNLAAGTVIGDASVGTDSLQRIESVRGTNFADAYVATGFSGSSTNAGSLGTFNEFEGLGGDDTITGNDNTRISYVRATGAVIVDLVAGTATGNASVGSDIITGGVNAVIGSTYADTISGRDDAPGLGDDEFDGRAGNDWLDGRNGLDTALYYLDSAVTAGITVDMAAGTVTGDISIGTDTLRSVENIIGTRFADTYVATGFSTTSTNAGSFGNTNSFEGMRGNDIVTGNGATLLVFSRATGAVTADILTGTATGNASVGTDTFTGVVGLRGSNFNDTLRGSNTSSLIEVFLGEGGNDEIDGRGGLDRVNYASTLGDMVTSGINVQMAAGIVTGDTSVGTDTLLRVEMVRGTRFADVYDATGFSGSSTNAGSNGTFNEFEGVGGNDTITGNGNTQIAFYNATGGGVTVDLAAGTATGVSIGSDTITGGVNSVAGSRFADNLSGSNNAPGIAEGFDGRAGNDVIDGRGGYDGAIYSNDTTVNAGIVVDMAAGIVTSTSAAIGTDTLLRVEAIRGTNFADIYDATGFSGTSTNAGSFGTFNDFEGMGGNDTVTGNGDTRVNFLNATGGVTVDLENGTAVGNASVGSDTFSGVSRVLGSNFDDIIIGNASNNYLESRNGNNIISGGDGSDTIIGGFGNDTLTGGNNADRFTFLNGFGEDIITDFQSGETDLIDLIGVTGVYDFATVQSLSEQDGADTVINFGGGNVIRLNNVYSAYLTASDFVFGTP